VLGFFPKVIKVFLKFLRFFIGYLGSFPCCLGIFIGYLGSFLGCLGFFKGYLTFFIRCVTTLALGSRPKQGLARLRAERKPGVTSHVPGSVGECEGSQGNSHLGSWSPEGFLNLQRTIAEVKTC
jgi:hypothetical protein